MKIEVAFPKMNWRAEFKHNEDITQQSILSFLSERVAVLEADVYVYLQENDEIPSYKTPHVKLFYVEQYNEQSTFLEFELRATEWAKSQSLEFANHMMQIVH
ncbi:hypothetical protein ACP179_15750 [Xenorhabdus stockiae]|uniref:hypothetical protein n=1 Tax=Xenorhabdus stockiae TaxID=351614 RepID=UPI003CF3A4B3